MFLTERPAQKKAHTYRRERPSPQFSSASRLTAGAAGCAITMELSGAVGFLRHLANVFARPHCWAIFLFECHH
jgi:hypothetical protein